ncbi:response regulator transcription factor [Micromonospora sp. WMMD723]|uniref:response regulator transcription factor n=1 Tax=unclassified Micromonospora TaxID=2617518 RepID=UPI003B9597B6
MLKVMIAEGMRLVRDALATTLTLEDDIDVVAQVSRGDDVFPVAARLRPHVLVLDGDLPGRPVVDVIADLEAGLPDCQTLLLASQGRPDLVTRAMAMRVRGLLLKQAPATMLSESIRKIAAGERVIDPELALQVIVNRDNPLTRREVDVLRLAAGGAEPTEIAKQLRLRVGTVRNYLSSIVVKLGARNRIDALRIASEEGWMNPQWTEARPSGWRSAPTTGSPAATDDQSRRPAR